jgi:hypothetical protein
MLTFILITTMGIAQSTISDKSVESPIASQDKVKTSYDLTGTFFYTDPACGYSAFLGKDGTCEASVKLEPTPSDVNNAKCKIMPTKHGYAVVCRWKPKKGTR